MCDYIGNNCIMDWINKSSSTQNPILTTKRCIDYLSPSEDRFVVVESIDIRGFRTNAIRLLEESPIKVRMFYLAVCLMGRSR